jgi:hypothetical protein
MDKNEKYIGYVIDLLNEISKRLNFKYKIKEVSDYGKFSDSSKNGTGYKWNGAMAELISGVLIHYYY